MIPAINTAKKHVLNFPGKRLAKKYIIFESDDWGSERIPSLNELKYLKSCGFNIHSNPFNYLDSLESGDDLSALFETLIKFKDSQGNHPVITANSVVANPDFEKIMASGYQEYHYESIVDTYQKKKNCENSFSLIQEGMSSGIFHPQFHGREHLNVQQWLNTLQSGNNLLLKAFNAGIYAIDIKNSTYSRANFTAAFDRDSEREVSLHREIINEGISLFNKIFGYVPESFIAPCYIWYPELESILLEKGIKYIQGLPIQYVPSNNKRYKKKYHYQGEKNKRMQRYFVRNCFFEPALNHGIISIDEIMKRLKIIFYWGKPAIIGTHRINFIGSLNEDNRKRNLEQLSLLIKKILKHYPDAEFTTTDKLGKLYTNNN